MGYSMLRISAEMGQEIADAVKEIVGKNINFIDKNGIIISSTDKTRIGSFNGAGHHACETKKIAIVDYENKYKDSRLGISYPILIENEAVGAVGITGNPDEVHKFGFMINKIAEIIIKEKMLSNKYKSREDLMDYIIKSLIYNEEQELKNIIKYYLSEFKINIQEELAFIFLNVDRNGGINWYDSQDKIISYFKSNGINIYSYIYPNKYVGIVKKEFYGELKNNFKIHLADQQITAGVGKFYTLLNLNKSYEQAKIAEKYTKAKRKSFVEMKEIALETIFESVDEDIRKEYIDTTVKDLDVDSLNLLKVYYKNNMSLRSAAEELFIHKNTLQYRLDKIYSKTELNPRNIEDCVKLYIGVMIKENINNVLQTN